MSIPAANISSRVRRSNPGSSAAASAPTSSIASSALRTSPSQDFGAYHRRQSTSSSTSNMPCFGSYQRCIGSSILPPTRQGWPHVTSGNKCGSAVKAFRILQTRPQRTSSPSIASPYRTLCVSIKTRDPSISRGCQGICTRGRSHSTRSLNSSSP